MGSFNSDACLDRVLAFFVFLDVCMCASVVTSLFRWGVCRASLWSQKRLIFSINIDIFPVFFGPEGSPTGMFMKKGGGGI